MNDCLLISTLCGWKCEKNANKKNNNNNIAFVRRFELNTSLCE